MKRRRAAILSSLTAFAIGGCGGPQPTPAPQVQVPVQQPGPVQQPPVQQPPPVQPTGSQTQTIQVETLAKGTESERKQPGYQVIRSEGEMESFIEAAGIKEAVPEVHWDSEMAVAVFSGERPGSIEIVEIKDMDGERTIKVSHRSDSDEEAEAATSYHLVVMPKTTDEIVVKGLPSKVTEEQKPAPAASPAPAPGNGPAPGTGQEQNAVNLVARGSASGVQQPVNVIIRTQEELQAVWNVHAQGLPQPAAMPNVDLNQHSVIGIFLGQSQAGGIELTQVGMASQQGPVVVQGKLIQGTGQAGTPFLMISVPKLPANLPVDIQIQGASQAQTLGNPQQQAQQPAQPGFGQPVQQPGFGQPVQQPGFGQPVSAGGTYGGQTGYPYQAFPSRGSLLTGGGSGGLLGPGGYVQQ